MARKMYLNFTKLCCFIIFGTVIYNEYLAYYIAYLYWPTVPSSACSLLFVADPQLQGNALEPPGGLKTKTKLEVDNNPGWEVNLRECIPPHELLMAGHTGGATLHYTSSAFHPSYHHKILNHFFDL